MITAATGQVTHCDDSLIDLMCFFVLGVAFSQQNLVAQTGDPTATGRGGESIFG